MNHVEQFLAAVGRATFEREVGVPTQSVTRAIRENMMPAGWYRGAKRLADAQGVDLPDDLAAAMFRWVDKRKSPARPREAAE